MTIGELIRGNHVIVGLCIAGKTQLLQDLARRAGSELSLDQRVILNALQARENLGSTGLGKGFALPHARLDPLPRSYALFARLVRPIDFSSINGLRVDLVILLLTPANGGDQHLATLAALSRPLRNEAFMQRLRRATDAPALHELLLNSDV